MLYENSLGENYEILRDRGFLLEVRFVETGNVRKVLKTLVGSGEVCDIFSPSVVGVGYLGQEDPPDREVYFCWKNMLTRCYDKSSKVYERYGGRGVKVDEEWHNYSNFEKWYRANLPKQAIKFDLDKDIIKQGCKNIFRDHLCLPLQRT